MEVLVQQGKVLYVGSSNFAGLHIGQAQHAAEKRNFLGLVSEQSKYSLATRQIELEIVPACRAYGVGIIAYSPLEGGLLGGVLAKARDGRRASEHIQKRAEDQRRQLEPYENLCRELGESPGNVALAWVLANPIVTGPIIGPRTIDQLNGALRAMELNLDDIAMSKLDEIWPGPGGEAPMAYAW